MRERLGEREISHKELAHMIMEAENLLEILLFVGGLATAQVEKKTDILAQKQAERK